MSLHSMSKGNKQAGVVVVCAPVLGVCQESVASLLGSLHMHALFPPDPVFFLLK